MTIRPLLQLFAHLAGTAFRILPRKKRYAAARRIALMVAPLLVRSGYIERRPSLLDGPREEALRMVLRTMTRARVEFNPEVEVRGGDLIAGRAVLIVSGHFLLNIHMSRMLFDAGRRFTAILGGPREPMYYFGTTVPIDFHYADSNVFLRMRQTLSEGSGVGFAIAELGTRQENWIEVRTVAGPRYVSKAAFAFAARTRTPVVFGATYLNPEGRVTITYEEPQATDGEGLTAEFCEFLTRHAAAVVR
ncbi:MAG TPA: hypothetical protein VFV49_18330 [Thermoanaerobaculia bacterium]|nr:hypothetical protein [Thermoanaerobaculia bacterium]